MKLNIIGNNPTITFAAEELKRYLEQIDSSLQIRFAMQEELGDNLSVGICDKTDVLLPAVADKTHDDAIHIDVTGETGVITGTNPRSVLIAVYRYLKELGAAFIRPGKDNETLPTLKIADTQVHVTEKADHRHRQVCIEGACSYEHVSDMIDWLPKVGMNGYYTQFVRPYGFFKVWYEHEGNRYLKKEYKSDEEYAEILLRLEAEIQQRDLIYAAVGHSWQCECVGLDGTYWKKAEEPVPEDVIPLLAEVNGKRELFGGVPINTNLCYSNPKVQNLMTDYMVQFVKEKPFTREIVFWQADSAGNVCQCEACSKLNETDWYFQMANLADEKFTKEGFNTKIVLILHRQHPSCEKLKNPDRFIIEYAPISRDFSELYPAEVNEEYLAGAVNPYAEEHSLEETACLLKSTKNYVKFMQDWYEKLGIENPDTVFYDYLLIWFHYHDPSYMICAKTIAEDTKNYHALGVDGISSCQGQRVFFPTVLPMATMAQFLWDTNTDYEAFKNKVLTEEYGEDGIALGAILEKFAIEELTKRMTGIHALDWESTKGEEMVQLIASRYPVIDQIKELVEANLEKENLPAAVRQSWEHMKYYPEFAKYWLDIWTVSFGQNDTQKTREVAVAMNDYVMRNEEHLHRVFDGCLFRRRIYFFFNNTKMPGIVLDLEDYEE